MRASQLILPLAVLIGALLDANVGRAATFTWSTSADVPVPLFNTEDTDAGVVQDGANLWVQTSLYPDWHRYLGTSLDHLVAQPEAVRDSSFTQPNGDDAYWSGGIWQDIDGTRYAILHIEYDYAVPRTAFLWKRRVGLATSSDQGATWHYHGDILTTNPARAGAPSPAASFQDFGCGDSYLFVDRRGGYFYLFYLTAWVYKSTGWRTSEVMSVARCQIADKMAPGKWFKWSGGAWTQAGLGGAEASVFSGLNGSGTDSCVVHYNSYLNAFVAFGHDSNGASWISTCSDITTQNWGAPDYTFPQRLLWYNWPVDPITHDRYEVGQTLRLYSSQANVSGVGTKYFPVSFYRNGNVAPTAQLLLPVEGTITYAPGPISLRAAAADSDGSVSKLEYFANGTLIGSLSGAPYVLPWTNVAPGQYRLSVRATDNLGAATDSAGVDLTVQSLTYEIWKGINGLSAVTNDDAVQSSGLSALMSYALNINNASALPQARLASDKLTMSYSPLRSDVTYFVERSTDLLNWSTNLVNQGTSSAGIVTASTPCSPNQKVFLRLRVTHPKEK